MTKQFEHVEVRFTVVDREYRLAEESERISPDWEDWLIRELRAHMYRVDADDSAIRVFEGPQHLATLMSRPVDDIAAKHGDEDWFHERSPCPWLGDALGYVEFAAAAVPDTWAMRSKQSELAGLVGHLTVGPVIDVVYGPCDVYQPLELKTFPLSHCLADKYGFHDGVISTDAKYMESIAAEINERMKKIGIANRVYAASDEARLLDLDKHTPFIFMNAVHPKHDPIVDLHGKRIRWPEQLLKNELIGLWRYDIRLGSNLQSIGFYGGGYLP